MPAGAVSIFAKGSISTDGISLRHLVSRRSLPLSLLDKMFRRACRFLISFLFKNNRMMIIWRKKEICNVAEKNAGMVYIR